MTTCKKDGKQGSKIKKTGKKGKKKKKETQPTADCRDRAYETDIDPQLKTRKKGEGSSEAMSTRRGRPRTGGITWAGQKVVRQTALT